MLQSAAGEQEKAKSLLKENEAQLRETQSKMKKMEKEAEGMRKELEVLNAELVKQTKENERLSGSISQNQDQQSK